MHEAGNPFDRFAIKTERKWRDSRPLIKRNLSSTVVGSIFNLVNQTRKDRQRQEETCKKR